MKRRATAEVIRVLTPVYLGLEVDLDIAILDNLK